MNIGKEKSPGGTWGGRKQDNKAHAQGVIVARATLSATCASGSPTRMEVLKAPFSLFITGFSGAVGGSRAKAFGHG